MEPSRLSLKRSLLISTYLAISLFTTTTLAQASSTTTATTTSSSSASSTSTSASTTASSTSASSSQTSTESSSASSTTSASMPKITSSTTSSGKLSMPTLSTSTSADTSIPTYPAPSVPPTSNAPYMRKSTLPNGTVFIAVGAIMGAFGLAILAWRAIVACLLHRSVERAAMAQQTATNKAAQQSFPAPPAQFYKYTDRDSTPSLSGPVAAGRGIRRTHRGATPSQTLSQTNLFFSPTAAGSTASVPGGNGGGGGGGGNARDSTYRDSRYLPSGFYAASSAAPPGGHSVGDSISMSNLGPSSRLDPTPPESPSVGPRAASNHHPRNFSTSTVNLNGPAGQRAPSAYLDDLLADNPDMFPPGGSNAQHHH